MSLSSFFGIKDKINLKRLVKSGLRIGKNCSIGSNVLLDPSFCWLIKIGDDCTLAPNVTILAHDASTKRYIGYTKIGAVIIGNKCFFGVGTIVLPGVHIGNNVVIGAGSIITHDIPDNCIVAGNPAEVIERTEKQMERHLENLKTRPGYPREGWTHNHGITEENKRIMYKTVEKTIGYVQ